MMGAFAKFLDKFFILIFSLPNLGNDWTAA